MPILRIAVILIVIYIHSGWAQQLRVASLNLVNAFEQLKIKSEHKKLQKILRFFYLKSYISQLADFQLKLHISSKNGLKLDQKWTKNGPKMDQQWTEIRPKMDQK